MPGKPAVFLDRDNTIIRNDGDLGDPDALELIQGAAMAIASLCGLGFKVVVVTNQGGVARGKYTEADVDAVHDRLREMVERAANGARIEAFYFCPYHPQGKVKKYAREHEDRKPKPGMLHRAAADHGLDLERSWMVGDQLRDVEAGDAAGCRTVWLNPDAGRDAQPATTDGGVKPDFTVRTLVEAVRIIASQRHARDEASIPARTTGKRYDAHAMAELQKPRVVPPAEDRHGEADRTDEAAGKPPATGARPFRPYDLPPDDPSSSEADEGSRPTAAAPPRLRLAQMVEKVKTVSNAARESIKAGAARGEAEAESPTEAVSPEGDPPSSVVSFPVPPAEQSGEIAPAAPPPVGTAPDSPPDPADQKLLRLILQELRGQRGSGAESGPATLIAMVVQAIAGVALLAGLWMGAGDDGLFLRWLGVALVAQLGVIALLLFGRSGR